jgi:hypothetical protein
MLASEGAKTGVGQGLAPPHTRLGPFACHPHSQMAQCPLPERVVGRLSSTHSDIDPS